MDASSDLWQEFYTKTKRFDTAKLISGASSHFMMAMMASISASAFTLSESAFLLPDFGVLPCPAPAAALRVSAVASAFPPDFFAKLAHWINATRTVGETRNEEEGTSVRAQRESVRAAEARTGQKRRIRFDVRMKTALESLLCR
jgi:hypothetical protein